MRKRRIKYVCIAIAVLGLLAIPAVHWRLIGWLWGESFYQARPTSYWRTEFEQWEFTRDRMVRHASWLEMILPKFLTGTPDASFPLQKGDPEATEVLIELLATDDPNHREMAIRGLSRIGPKAQAAVPVLLRSVNDRDVGHRALIALGDIGLANEEVLGVLVRELKNKDGFRWSAAWAFAKLGQKGSPALPQILQALKADDILDQTSSLSFRTHLIEALGQMKDEGKDVVPVLVSIAERPKSNAELAERVQRFGRDPLDSEDIRHAAMDDAQQRRCAVRALANLGEEAQAAIPALRTLLKDDDYELHYLAEKAIHVISGDEPEVSLDRIEKLARTGAAAIPQLQPFLEDENRHVRAAAERAVKLCTIQRLSHTTPSSLPELQVFLQDRDPVVRCAAASALSQIKP